MAYAIEVGEAAPDAIRRVALEQIDRALAEVADATIDRHEAVHQVRKRCKKVRALLKLARTGLAETYREENARFRDASRPLSHLRDAQVHLDAFRALRRDPILGPSSGPIETVESMLVGRRDRAAAGPPAIDDALRQFADRMRDARIAVPGWRMFGGSEVFVEGFEKTYRRARKRVREASEDPSSMRLHEWRKRVKDHGYHLRLVQPLAGSGHRQQAQTVEQLGDVLGRDHDLVGLRLLLVDDPELSRCAGAGDLVERLDQRRARLQEEAFSLARTCLALGPRKLVRRLDFV